jgi:hypothetical protein
MQRLSKLQKFILIRAFENGEHLKKLFKPGFCQNGCYRITKQEIYEGFFNIECTSRGDSRFKFLENPGARPAILSTSLRRLHEKGLIRKGYRRNAWTYIKDVYLTRAGIAKARKLLKE